MVTAKEAGGRTREEAPAAKEAGGRKKEEVPAGRGFRKLIAWQKAQALASAVYASTSSQQMPPWLVSQVMRSALSVSGNIAEGYTRGGVKDYLRFLDIARASLAELESHLHFMVANGLLDPADFARITPLASDVGNILVALMRSLAVKAKDGSWNRIAEDRPTYGTSDEIDTLLPPSSFLLPGGDRR